MSDAARIVVPCGWKRNVDSSKSAVSYISPSGVALSSIVEVFQYLEKDDTCKCGLSCPIYVPKVFSFNPDVETTYYTREEWINYRNKSDVRMNKCQHWLKLRKMQKGKSKTTAPKSSSAEPPPKLLIIRKDGKLRSVIPDIRSSSDKHKQSTSTDTTKRMHKSTGTAVRKANEVADLKLSLTCQSISAPPSRNPSVTSPLKSPLFEPTTVTSVSNSNVKSKLQWIKADFETSGNDAESDTELCFSPDFKESPTTPLPQSLMSRFVCPSKAQGFDAANRSMPVKSYGDSVARFGAHQDGNFVGTRPTNFAYMGVSSYDTPSYMQGNIRSLPQSNHIRHPSSTISSNPKFGGIAVHEQVRQCNSAHTPSDDQRQFLTNDGATLLHQGAPLHSNQSGNMFNTGTSAQATPAQQRLPLASPPLLNPVSPYNFPMNNNGMMAPMGSPVGTNPSPFSSRSQSRSSSVGTPALSPGGIWPGPRHNVSDSSRPMSRSSSTATPGPDVSPGSGLGQWNGNGPNSANYNVRTPSCSFLPVLSPGSVNSFPARFPTLPSTYSRFPHDGSAASGSSKYHQAPYPLEYAASQRLRMHSQACHQQHAQRFEVPPRFRHYGPSQPTFVNNAQFSVLMTGDPQQISHKPNESLHQNMYRPAPPYSATKMQPSRMGEPDGIAHAQPKFPFNSRQFNQPGPQQETGNIVQQQFAQQQWQYNASMTPRQYFAQNMMRPRAPITPTQRPQLRPPKPKRTRKRKTKVIPSKVEPVADTSTIKSEFPEIFDPQEISGLIPTTELLMEDTTKTMKFNTSDLIQENSSLTYTPSLVLPSDVTAFPTSVSSSQLIRINPSSLLQSEKINNDDASLAKDLPEIDKPDSSERDVTTPPLRVLSPTCMLDNPGSPEDDHFPEMDFGSTVSTSFLNFNPVTSAVTLAAIVSVSSQSVTAGVVSTTDITSSASVNIPTSTKHNTHTDIFPASTVGNDFNIKNMEVLTSVTSSKQQVCTPSVFAVTAPFNTTTSIVNCGIPISSVKDGDMPTSALSSKRELSVTALFTTAVSSSVVTQSTWSEKKLDVCSSSKSDSAMVFRVNSCLPNFSSFMHLNRGVTTVRGGSSDVTSLVSSSGTLFQLPKLSKPKCVYIQRKLSFQTPAVCTDFHTTTSRRRYFSEPWQSHKSATISRIGISSPNLTCFQTTPKTVIGKAENLQSKILQPQPTVFANVAKTVENFNDNTIYPKRNTVIDDTCNDRSLSETTTTNSLQEVTEVTMDVTPNTSDAASSTMVRSTVGETLPQDLCIRQNIDQPLQEDVSSMSNTADMTISKSLDVNVAVSTSNLHGSNPFLSTDKTVAVDITVKDIVNRLVEEASSITSSNQQTICKEEEPSGSSYCDKIVSSPHSSTNDSTSQECSNTDFINKQSPTKPLVADCQFGVDDGTNAQSSVLGQTKTVDPPSHNDLIISKIPTADIPGALELTDAHMQTDVDDIINSENIDRVMVNSPQLSERISTIVTGQEDDCSMDSSKTPKSNDTSHTVTDDITHDQSQTRLCLNNSADVNADLHRSSDASSETVNICPFIPKFENLGDNVDSHSTTSKNETACDLSPNIQDSQSEACPPTGKCEGSMDPLHDIHGLQSEACPPTEKNECSRNALRDIHDLPIESCSSMIKSVGSQDLPQNIKETQCKSHSPTSKSESILQLPYISQDMERESHLTTSQMECTPILPQAFQNSPTGQSLRRCDLPHESQSESEDRSPVNKCEIIHSMPQRIQDLQSNSCSPTGQSDSTRALPQDTHYLASSPHSPICKSDRPSNQPQDAWELQCSPHSPTCKSESARDLPQNIQDSPNAPHSPTSKGRGTHNIELGNQDLKSTPHSPKRKSESTSDQPHNTQDVGSGPHSPANKIKRTQDNQQDIHHSQNESHSPIFKSESLCDLPLKLPDSRSDSLPLASKSETKWDQESQSKFDSTNKSESPRDLLQNIRNLQGFPESICAGRDEMKVVSDPVSELPTSGGDEPQPIISSNAENVVSNIQKLQGTMSAGASEDHDNITTSQASSEYCGAVVSSPMNIPPEWTTTVIQQLSSYNRILKNLLVRQVSPAANIAQLTSGSPNTDAKQADVITALLSDTVPQMTSAEIFHKTATAMHGTPTMPVLPVKDHQSAPQTFDPSIHPSTSQKVFDDAHQCASTVSDKPPALRGVKSAHDDAKTLLAVPLPPDSSQPLEDDAKIAKSFRGSDASHQGLQVPIVSSSVKGTQEESNNATIEANNDGVQPQDKVTTSVKSMCQTAGVTLERRRGRSRTAANKQAIKKQLTVEKPPVEKAPKRATSSGSSSHRSSQKSTRIVKNGDLVWGQMRGFPSWPGKIVKPSEVRGLQQRAPLSDGKVWVKWFGDHTFTQMNPADLVTMTEGLEAHHKSRRKGRTRTKKISAHLETAIQEAVDELEQQQGTSSRRFVEALQAAPLLGTTGKEQCEKPKRGRKRKAM